MHGPFEPVENNLILRLNPSWPSAYASIHGHRPDKAVPNCHPGSLEDAEDATGRLRPETNGSSAMALPPAQPAYILRGHGSQIHATAFIRSNRRLMTGDADGWIALWSLTIKRPVAVWRAHAGSILGASAWGKDKLIT